MLVAAALSKALENYCAGHAIYTLNAFHAQELAARLVLKSVTVEDQQLIVILDVGA